MAAWDPQQETHTEWQTRQRRQRALKDTTPTQRSEETEAQFQERMLGHGIGNIDAFKSQIEKGMASEKEKRGYSTPLREDIGAGEERAQKIFGGLEPMAGQYQDVLGQRLERAQRGLTTPEQQQMRGAGQAQLRALKASQGAAGVKGGTATSQQADIMAQTEANIAAQNIMARERAIGDLESALGRRLFGIQSGGLSEAQLGVAERGSERGLAIAQQPAPSMSSGTGLFSMIGNLFR